MSVKGFCLLCVLPVFFIIIFGNTLNAEPDDPMCVPMGTIELKPPESVEAKKNPVDFPHSQHFVIDCKTCHHQWGGTEGIQSCSASDCHNLTEIPAADEGEAYQYYKSAFHDKCIGCHRDMKKKNRELENAGTPLTEPLPETGPTSCSACHPK